MALTKTFIAAAVLLKPPHGAKSRLTHFSPGQRSAFAQAMAADVLTAVTGSAAFQSVFIVSAAPEYEMLAQDMGVGFLPEENTCGLNTAAERAIQYAQRSGAQYCTLIPGDVPLADADAITSATARFLQAACADIEIGLAPCRREDGTNLLYCRTSVPPVFSYGAGSFRRHAAQRPAFILRDDRIELDIDEPADVSVLSDRIQNLPRPPKHTLAFLHTIDRLVEA